LSVPTWKISHEGEDGGGEGLGSEIKIVLFGGEAGRRIFVRVYAFLIS
jgi:hypothetical protein